MNILVLNCGSSSAKYKLIEVKSNTILAEGGVFIKFSSTM